MIEAFPHCFLGLLIVVTAIIILIFDFHFVIIIVRLKDILKISSKIEAFLRCFSKLLIITIIIILIFNFLFNFPLIKRVFTFLIKLFKLILLFFITILNTISPSSCINPVE